MLLSSIPALQRLTRVGPWAVAALLGAVAPLVAQSEAPPFQTLDYPHDTGRLSNDSLQAEVLGSFVVRVEAAEWLRLQFDQVQLSGNFLDGSGAILRITSLEDAAVQELNAWHVEKWQNTSAYFNGDSVLVEVVSQPGTGASRVVLGSVMAGLPPADSQCGPTDDRILSQDPRAGRLLPIGCTAWLINDCNNCMLTAGHCTGNINVVEFNVPMSNSNGSINHPPPEDQYAIDASSLQTNGGQGVGNDYAYFGTFPNSITGLTAAQAQGAVFTVDAPPAFDPSEDIRITGYGTDNTPSSHNQVQQTNAGPWVTSSGTTLQYRADTTGGNSGSPVIHEPSGVAIGIHTHGGCNTNGSGQNSGTSFAHPGLQTFLSNPAGVCEGGVALVGTLPTVLPPGAPTQVTVNVAGMIVPGSATLLHRTNGGSYTSQAMVDLGNGMYQGTLPAGVCGDFVEFYFEVDLVACGVKTLPQNAPANVFAADVAVEMVLVEDDFENNLGWTAQNGGATTGDWDRGVPVDDPGWDYDPASDSDGSGQCFLTQNQVGNTDVDDGSVLLFSPSIDMSAGNIRIQYDYFLNLTNTDGTDRLLVEINNNGGSGSWIEVARHDSSGGLSWRTHTITQADLDSAGVVLTSDMVLRYTTNDGNPQSINESGLDAFRVSAVGCGGCPTPVVYCTPKPGMICGVPAIGFNGGSSASSSSGFEIFAGPARGIKGGVLLYSLTGPAALPFQGGTLCVNPTPLRRANAVSSGGTLNQCDGEFRLDMNAFASGSIGGNPDPALTQVGTVVNTQWWGRDSVATGSYLSDAIEYEVCP